MSEPIRQLWPLLLVQDINRSVEFYRDLLGFAMVGRAEWEGKFYWCRLERGGACLMLREAESDAPPRELGGGPSASTSCATTATPYTQNSPHGVWSSSSRGPRITGCGSCPSRSPTDIESGSRAPPGTGAVSGAAPTPRPFAAADRRIRPAGPAPRWPAASRPRTSRSTRSGGRWNPAGQSRSFGNESSLETPQPAGVGPQSRRRRPLQFPTGGGSKQASWYELTRFIPACPGSGRDRS